MSHVHEGYFTAGLDADPELAESIRGELRRQQDGVELIASENIVSRLVLEAQGSVMTNKTVEGLPYDRYYGGAEFADAIEALAIKRACQVFGCRFANVQPHSGSNANAGVFLGLLKLGDPILSMNVAAGGHISHGHPATLTGRDYTIASYSVSRETERIDLDEVRDLALRHWRFGISIHRGLDRSRPPRCDQRADDRCCSRRSSSGLPEAPNLLSC